MTAANSLSLILRRLDEIERKLDRIMEELRDPHGHRLFGTSWQSSKEGLNDRWWRTDASLLQCTLRDEGDRASAGVPAFGCRREQLLTNLCQFDILQSGPWEGTECNSIN